MTGAAMPAEAPRVLAGHNRFSNQALTSLAKAACAEVLEVPAQEVRVEWRDDDGLLALSLVTPLGLPGLSEVVRDPEVLAAAGGSIWDRAVDAKADIRARVMQLSGSELSRVDIRISGVLQRTAARVR
ncbi:MULTISPECIES: hypothetical protein [Arthrobacter]|uniref:YbaB/EbfC DNA-binding family protein n=2 Tax=Arthrobacter TaxID=1663 RepID=A0ABU9KIA7_9MICC|nr:hypothetical protein [Arthrobacter sp. YJM1]MDP5226426.1 hypothetical protein [Arthrobacter sp. YJM1]